MAKYLTLAALAAGVPRSGTLDALSASTEPFHDYVADHKDETVQKIDSLQAMAVRGFASVSGNLKWVKATQHFYVAFEPITAGDLLQIPEKDAAGLVRDGKAVYATDDEIAAAQKATK